MRVSTTTMSLAHVLVSSALFDASARLSVVWRWRRRRRRCLRCLRCAARAMQALRASPPAPPLSERFATIRSPASRMRPEAVAAQVATSSVVAQSLVASGVVANAAAEEPRAIAALADAAAMVLCRRRSSQRRSHHRWCVAIRRSHCWSYSLASPILPHRRWRWCWLVDALMHLRDPWLASTTMLVHR